MLIGIARRWRRGRARATRPGAYLSSNAAMPGGPANARDRIGRGPWQNFKGVVVAQNVDDLHSDNNKLSMENSLTERGTIVSGTGMTPNWHDVLTGSTPEGRAFPANMKLHQSSIGRAAPSGAPCSVTSTGMASSSPRS